MAASSQHSRRNSAVIIAAVLAATALLIVAYRFSTSRHETAAVPAAVPAASAPAQTEPAPDPVLAGALTIEPAQPPAVIDAPNTTKGALTLTIPALKNASKRVPVLEGWDTPQVDAGIGHYKQSSGPGEFGNYVLAGHRSSHVGFEPWANLPGIPEGSEVIIESKTAVYTYKLFKSKQVLPDAMWTVAQEPAEPGKGPISTGSAPGSKQLITLVTCTPRYGHSGRFIWWGRLASATPKSA